MDVVALCSVFLPFSRSLSHFLSLSLSPSRSFSFLRSLSRVLLFTFISLFCLCLSRFLFPFSQLLSFPLSAPVVARGSSQRVHHVMPLPRELLRGGEEPRRKSGKHLGDISGNVSEMFGLFFCENNGKCWATLSNIGNKLRNILQYGPWSNIVNRQNDCGNVGLVLELGRRLCAHIGAVHMFTRAVLHQWLYYGPQSVGVNTPPGWRHPCFYSPRINQPSPMRTLSPPLQILSTTVQSSYYFPWHGTSFPRSTIHIHVKITRHPVFSLCLTTDHSVTLFVFVLFFFSCFSFLVIFVLLVSK